MRKPSWKWFKGLGFVWVDGDIINQTAWTWSRRLREEVGEFTFGYFEFGTFMSPRFLFLVFRNLKTKRLGFGIESSIFPQILFRCGSNKKGLMASRATESYMKMEIFDDSAFQCMWPAVTENQKQDDTDPIKILGTFSINVFAVNATYFHVSMQQSLFFLIHDIETKLWKKSCSPFPVMPGCKTHFCFVFIL